MITGQPYDGYCLRCAVHNGIEVKRNYRTKEMSVVDFIIESFPDLDWIHNKRVDGGCSRRQGDLRLELGHIHLIIEIDENQHDFYLELCERARYHQIAADVFCTAGEHPIVFLRFNPDSYVDNVGRRHPSPWRRLENGLVSIEHEALLVWADRLQVLHDRISYYLDKENTPRDPLKVETMFYNCHNPSSPYPSLELQGRL